MAGLLGSIVMVAIAIAIQVLVTRWFFRRLTAREQPSYLGEKTWTEPVQDDTDRFIEEMDQKLDQPAMWRHVP